MAFRGTEQGSWRDILTDLHLVPAPMDPDRVATAPMHAGATGRDAWHCRSMHGAGTQQAILTGRLPACRHLYTAHAALADVSAPPQEPGPLRRIIDKVERAKEQVAAERQQAEEEASSGSQVGGPAWQAGLG